MSCVYSAITCCFDIILLHTMILVIDFCDFNCIPLLPYDGLCHRNPNMDLVEYAMNHARNMSEVKGLPLSHKREYISPAT